MFAAPEREPGRTTSFVLAVLIHLLFLGLLVFGIHWQSKQPQVTEVDLWNNFPTPEVKSEPTKQEVKPEPKPEPKPGPKPEPVAKSEPKPDQADILFKQKLEKQNAEQQKIEKEKTEKKKRELEEQQKLAEAQHKAEAERQRQIKEQLAKEEDARRLQQDQEAAVKALQVDQETAADRLLKDYRDRIQAKIRHYVVVPPGIEDNPQAIYKVVLLPGGNVLSAILVKSSGVPAYDSSIVRAIYNAQPLPLPSDAALFQNFRELELKFRPND
jgi:colicin import membrane protein